MLWVQGYLAHKKHPLPRTLQWDYTLGPLVVLGGGALSYERGTPVQVQGSGAGGAVPNLLEWQLAGTPFFSFLLYSRCRS